MRIRLKSNQDAEIRVAGRQLEDAINRDQRARRADRLALLPPLLGHTTALKARSNSFREARLLINTVNTPYPFPCRVQARGSIRSENIGKRKARKSE